MEARMKNDELEFGMAVCPQCEMAFVKRSLNKAYCSVKCRKAAERKRALKRDAETAVINAAVKEGAFEARAISTVESPDLKTLKDMLIALKILRTSGYSIITGALPEGWDAEWELQLAILPSPDKKNTWILQYA